MAITTVGEANAASAVIRFFLDLPGYAGRLNDGDALIAVLRLRQSAYDKLTAGPLEDDVREAFARHRARADAGDNVLDAAMWRVWQAGDWPVITAAMSLAEREAAADAVLRYDATLERDGDESFDPHPIRWWRVQ